MGTEGLLLPGSQMLPPGAFFAPPEKASKSNH